MGRNCAPGDSVRKDNDLLDDGFRLKLGRNREPVLAQLRSDVGFLRELGFLDYSLLIGARRRWRLPRRQSGPTHGVDDLKPEGGPTRADAAVTEPMPPRPSRSFLSAAEGGLSFMGTLFSRPSGQHGEIDDAAAKTMVADLRSGRSQRCYCF